MWIILLLAVCGLAHAADEVVGERPYEMVWADRTQDDHPPLVDFETMDGWQVWTKNTEAKIERTREQQIWDRHVGKLTYRATGAPPTFSFGPAQPLKIAEPFEAVSCWIYGNNWGYSPNPRTPSVSIAIVFLDSRQREVRVPLTWVNWEEWFLCTKRLTPEQIAMVKDGASFVGFEVTGGRNKEDRVLYFDNLAVFVEQFPPLTFEPRPARGIPMFPGQTTGTNTGPGKLPFPTRLQTILPDNLTKDFKTSAIQQGEAYVFTYKGADGTLVYKVTPQTGTWSDVTAFWQGRSGTMRPLVEGGAYLEEPRRAASPLAATVGAQGTERPTRCEPLGNELKDSELISRWRMTSEAGSAEVTYVYRLWNKSLVIDTIAPGGAVAEVRYGHAEGVDNPRLVTNPYYHYDPARPAVVVMGPPDKPLFLTGNTDWYLSNASTPFAVNEIKEGRVSYQGGTRYIAKTDGQRNDVYERFFVTVSPLYEEVLPTVPNPVSPWKQIAGTHVWRAHGAGNRANDAAYWTNVWRHGMTECLITDHESGWRDGGESFTFRTKAAPKKGGDQGQYDYARLMQDKLGFVYGPYNNYTDFAPVNEFWSFDLIGRTAENQLQTAWMRCYAPKPARAVEYCAKLAPIIQEKFKFSTAYCDVHTAVSPWSRTDYDTRVPGGGTFTGTFYSYGEIMLLQKKAWNGPVYSEGNHHFWYSGLTDGNYAQDRGYDIPDMPWLVDLDLREMHDLCCNFGMGAPSMFYGRDEAPGTTQAEKDEYVDRFLAATVAFGHPGFLVMEGGFNNALRSYYMLQQLHSDYTQVSAADIRYLDAKGEALPTSLAVATGAYTRSQVMTRYANGTATIVNGSRSQRMKIGGTDLPPNGYVGWTKDKSIFVASTDSGPGTPRHDYCVSPAYIYVDGRGSFTRQERAASDGIGICRLLGKGKWEVIPYKGADCGFAINAMRAVALDKEGKEIGPAQLRVSRGLTYVVPVEGAFSYVLTANGVLPPTPSLQGGGTALACPRDEVVPGETVVVKGKQEHPVKVPSDAKPGQRIWQQFEGGWIDFTVVAMTDATVELRGNTITVSLRSNLPDRREGTVSLLDQKKPITLQPRVRQEVAFDLGAPTREDSVMLVIEIRAGDLVQKLERGLRTVQMMAKLADLPAHYDTGMALRGQAESNDFGETRGFVSARLSSSGEVSKAGIFMHPPYMGGVGYAFARYDAITLPQQPAAFRAVVGKADGSDPGDGILYKLAVVDAAGKQTIIGEQTVLKHQWLPMEGDLSRWAGQQVQLQLISDVGLADNSSGDWACWADMRLESLKPVLSRILAQDSEEFRREPAPFPAKGLTVEDLRRAVKGRLVYDGNGLSGTGAQYGSFAQLNGVNLGNMAPAGGDEVKGIWAEQVSVPLNAEAIATLGRRNVFVLLNPGRDYFKVRRFWIELELPDGRKASTDIAAAAYTQPPEWPYAEGIGVPFVKNIEVELWFDL
jgi:hypothetical protein